MIMQSHADSHLNPNPKPDINPNANLRFFFTSGLMHACTWPATELDMGHFFVTRPDPVEIGQ